MLPNASPNPQVGPVTAGLWLLGKDTQTPPKRDRQADQAARTDLFAALRARGIEPAPGSGLSHSGGFAVYGESVAGSRIGVDLEWIRERDVVSLAEFAYSPQEYAWLKTLTDTERQTAFVELWVLKEAAGKALGLDLFDALRNCRFVLAAKRIKAHLPRGEECICGVYSPRKMLRAAWVGVHTQYNTPGGPPPLVSEITAAQSEKPVAYQPAYSSGP
jgi:hypothetical protein